MPGGFLGVDVFFVISGYLITSLLLSEYRRGGHIQVGKFWLRRARRLLPAVGVFIAVTMIVAAIVEPDRMNQLRGDAICSGNPRCCGSACAATASTSGEEWRRYRLIRDAARNPDELLAEGIALSVQAAELAAVRQ